MNDDRGLLAQCIDAGGPVHVTRTVAQIDVCGRCGYTVALHARPIDINVVMREMLYRGRAKLAIG
jgi:hypothetical protein